MRRIATLLLFCLMSPAVFAQEIGTAQAPLPKLEKAKLNPRLTEKRLQVGPSLSTFTYEEPGLMKDTGVLAGVGASYTGYSQDSAWQYRGELEFLSGRHTYEGHLLDGNNTPLTTTGYDRIFNGRVRIGPAMNDTANFMWVPYLGVGYRNLQNKDEGSGAYYRQITYLYLPFGAEFAWLQGERARMRAGLEADLLVNGRVQTNLSDVSSDLPNLENRQSSGYGLRASFAVEYDFGGWTGSIQPYMQYWSVAASDQAIATIDGTQYAFMEPENRTLLTGAQLSVLF